MYNVALTTNTLAHSSQASSYIREELVSTIIAMISENTEEHSYSVHRLYHTLTEDISHQSLAQVAVWTIGEFGDLLVAGSGELEGNSLEVNMCVMQETDWMLSVPADLSCFV